MPPPSAAPFLRMSVSNLCRCRARLFLAGKAFQRYRMQRGTRSSILPDFFIGAHAAVARFSLFARDPRRYRTYFPGMDLIAPYEVEPTRLRRGQNLTKGQRRLLDLGDRFSARPGLSRLPSMGLDRRRLL